MATSQYRRWFTAAAWRDAFDHFAPNRPVLLVLGLILAATGVAAWVASGAPPTCKPLPVAVIRLEVTFSASRFFSLLGAEGCDCRKYAIKQLGWPDVVFSLIYPFALAATYLWIERWRRRTSENKRILWPDFERWQAWVVVGPFVAGVLDIVEDLTLSAALKFTGAAGWLVVIGSTASMFKWLLLLVWAAGTLAELYRGPRGRVLRLVRFSALAVVAGALPLLAIPQGQDILQRAAEDELHALGRVNFGALALFAAALAVWYSARRLVQLNLDKAAAVDAGRDDHVSALASSESAMAMVSDESPAASVNARWYDFFGEQIPRILGVALLVLGGLAFARAGMFWKQYAVVALVSFVVVRLLERFLPPPKDDGEPNGIVKALRMKGAGRRAIGLVVSAGLYLLIRTSWGDDISDFGDSVFSLRTGATLCLILTWLFYLIVIYRRVVFAVASAPGYEARLEDLQRAAVRHDPSTQPYSAARVWVPRVAAVASLVLLFVFTEYAVPFGRFIGALWVLTIFTMNTVFFGSLLVYAHKRWRVAGVRLGLALAVLASLWNENHNIRKLDTRAADGSAVPSIPRGAPSTGANAGPPRPMLDVQVKQWLDSMSTPTLKPIVLVAAAGGGLRAAYWTAIALANIQDSVPEFASHIAAMSGVSGGSLGIAMFAALVRDQAGGNLPCASDPAAQNEQPAMPGKYSTCVRRLMRDDYLSPVLAKLLAPDFAQRFIPIPIPAFDRSTAIEESWEQSYFGASNHNTFAEGLTVFPLNARAGTAPLMVFNTTHVESGKRYVESPAIVEGAFDDTRDVLSLLKTDLRLSTAVHNSARFTYVSPAGHLDRGDGNELGRVVDGGYFENSGLVTLRELYNLVRRNDSSRTRTIIALYLCNDPVACETDARSASTVGTATICKDTSARAGAMAKDTSVVDSLAKTRSTLASEVVAPIQAVLDARDARGALARAEMKRTLGPKFLQLNVCGLLRTEGTDSTSEAERRGRERLISPPLGWSLSQYARKRMDQSLGLPNDPTSNGTCPRSNRAQLDSLERALKS